MCIFFIKLSNGRYLYFLISYLCHVSQEAFFSRSRFFGVQVFQSLAPGFRSSPKVDQCFKLFAFTLWYLWLQFFFIMYQGKKIYAPNLVVALKFSFMLGFLFSEKFFQYIMSWLHKTFPVWKYFISHTSDAHFLYTKENMC